MLLAYVVAFVVAMVLGTIKAATHPKFQYWLRFDAAAVRLAQIPVAVVHGTSGLLVAGLADHWDWEPLSSGAGRGWVNGAVYGLGAVALLRLELTSFGLSSFSPARTLLRYGFEYFEDWLDVKAARGVARRVGDLQPRALCRLSWRLYLRYVEPNCQDELATYQTALYLREVQVRALEAEGMPPFAPDEVDAIKAREHLRHFCEVLITGFCDATVDLEEDRDRDLTVRASAEADVADDELHPSPPPAHDA